MKTKMQMVALAIFFVAFFVVDLAQAGEVKGKVSAAGLKTAENIAVYIDTIPGKKFDHPADHVSVDQRNSVFMPHTMVILRGTTVDFLNSNHVAHNVYWPSVGGDKRLRHSLTNISPGQTKSFEFDDLGSVQLLCNLHLEMVAYIVVVPTPYFALTGSDGSFALKDVPPGTYTLKTWSEDVKSTCHICHSATGPNPTPDQILKGEIPPLTAVIKRVNLSEFVRKVTSGAPIVMGNPSAFYRGRMPVFSYLSQDEAAAAYLYLTRYPPQP
jgi:plastocyanin